MKYIKKFEAYKVDNNIKQDIEHILGEVLDDGFSLDIDFGYDDDYRQSLIVTIERGLSFNSDLVEDYLVRLVDYINTKYEVLKYKYAIYKRIPSRTTDGINTFTTDTKYFQEFPNDSDVKSIGVDILVKSNEMIVGK